MPEETERDMQTTSRNADEGTREEETEEERRAADTGRSNPRIVSSKMAFEEETRDLERNGDAEAGGANLTNWREKEDREEESESGSKRVLSFFLTLLRKPGVHARHAGERPTRQRSRGLCAQTARLRVPEERRKISTEGTAVSDGSLLQLEQATLFVASETQKASQIKTQGALPLQKTTGVFTAPGENRFRQTDPGAETVGREQ
ncbi:hypothetical protein TGP89_361020 [Toxoplasma gondii p89]|uniref:Uncharacterized protein n=1 Tax=Toxoplasma gondii p89 TaxID=943119 RepID=A0A086JVK1_TOXGO|nr:hypothetical protein TGP89_361020 [Toxoplasma gondii p89]